MCIMAFARMLWAKPMLEGTMSVIVQRAYNHPDEVQSVLSNETVLWGQPNAPFRVTYLQRRRLGGYEGVSVKGFQAMRREGALLPLTPYVRWDSSFTQSGNAVLQWSYNDGNKRISRGAFGDFWEMFGRPADWLYTKEQLMSVLSSVDHDGPTLVREAAAKLWEGFDAGTFLAQLLQTVRMIVNLRKRIYEYLLKPVPPKRVGKVDGGDIRKYSSAYLEWVFGWNLLMKDLSDLSTSLNAYDLGNGAMSSQVRDSQQLPGAAYDSKVGPRGNGESLWMTINEATSLGVVGRVVAKTSRYGAPYFNAPITLYEIIPYTWVLDYFWDLGSWIKSLAASFEADLMYSAYGLKLTASKSGVVSKTSTTPGSLLTNYIADGGFSSRGEVRMRVPASAHSLPRLNYPSYWKQLANLAAILGQGLRFK